MHFYSVNSSRIVCKLAILGVLAGFCFFTLYDYLLRSPNYLVTWNTLKTGDRSTDLISEEFKVNKTSITKQDKLLNNQLPSNRINPDSFKKFSLDSPNEQPSLQNFNKENLPKIKENKEGIKTNGTNSQKANTTPNGSMTSANGREAALSNFLEEQKLRKLILKDGCAQMGMNHVSRYNQDRIIISRKSKLVYCPVYKSASTSLTDLMNELQGNKGAPSLFSIEALRKYFAVESISRSSIQSYNDYTKFIAVRHPLERALSAYRDKFEKPWLNPFYFKKYGQNMVERYRKTPSNLTSKEKSMMMSAIKEGIKNKGNFPDLTGNIYSHPIGPTFEEYVKFVCEHQPGDEHWRPFSIYCKPCQMNYNFIFKFETLGTDVENFLSYLNRTDLQLHVKGVNRDGKTNPVLCSYLGQISLNDFMRLVRVYQNDLMLFGYSYDSYLGCLKKDLTDQRK